MDLAKLNSATKYPSILTYHEMGDRGRLQETVQVPFDGAGDILVTEKVDGTNARIILLPDMHPIVHFGSDRYYLIGSREELLTAEGDLIYAPDYGIADALREIAEKLPCNPEKIVTLYFEVFGGDLPASKQYTDKKRISVRHFDLSSVPMDILDMPIEKIAAWRDAGGQKFIDTHYFEENLLNLEHEGIHLEPVPPLGEVSSLPTSLEATYEWLKTFAASKCDLGGGKGRCEGVVVRTWDRSKIAKLRFEDYERTLGVKRG
jgi:hypothetical protein